VKVARRVEYEVMGGANREAREERRLSQRDLPEKLNRP
jgi:hypothetical protein